VLTEVVVDWEQWRSRQDRRPPLTPPASGRGAVLTEVVVDWDACSGALPQDRRPPLTPPARGRGTVLTEVVVDWDACSGPCGKTAALP
jgi:hypothetical protein